MSLVSLIHKHIIVTILGCLCLAFGIATIVLAVINADLSQQVDDLTPVIPTTTSIPTQPPGPTQPWEEDFRLPADIIPVEYDVSLYPNLDTGTFTGTVKIHIKTTTVARTYVPIHKKSLNITSTELVHLSKRHELTVETVEYAPFDFWVVIPTPGLETTSHYEIIIKFNGILTGKNVGFYQSLYQDADGVTRTIATSFFEPSYAREAFPCLDEPGFKANFTIHLVRPTEGYHALSNMKIKSEAANTPSTGLTTVTFATTPPMVTYLACFIISDFTALDPVDVSNPENSTYPVFPFQVYATPAQILSGHTQYAVDIGVKATSYLIDYFLVAFPLPKLDVIAIPDLVPGGMENWGLIVEREQDLLYGDDMSSASDQRTVANVLIHELSHMWFGDIVTLKWWDDLWLNEGFATFMSYKGTDEVEPLWIMMDQFVILELHPALKLDATLSSHAIVQPINDPDEIGEFFDNISYMKGGSVIRMLEDFMGEVKFQLGIQAYLKKYQFSNAETQDLWDALQEYAEPGVDITMIMDTWTRQMGFPVITVTSSDSGAGFVLKQDRFLANPDANATNDSQYNYKWEIPISYVTDLAPNAVQDGHRVWMHQNDESVIVPLPAGAKWMKLNFNQIGFYRVNYEPTYWTILNTILATDVDTLTVADRANLLDDVFSLADSQHVTYNIALDMSKYLEKEMHYIPWYVGSLRLEALNSLLANSMAYLNLRTYVQKLVGPAYSDVTWTIDATDAHLRRQLRSTVLNLACSFGHPSCLTEVRSHFTTWLADPTVRPAPDIRSLVYRYGMGSDNTEANWDTMWLLYLSEKDAQEKAKLMGGLSAAKEPWLLNRLIKYAENPEFVRSQDYLIVLTDIASNPVGTPIVWDFVRSEWEYLLGRFPPDDLNFINLIPRITSSFTTQLKLEEMEAFFDKYPDAGAGSAGRAQALETVANRIKWLEMNEEPVRDWLQQ